MAWLVGLKPVSGAPTGTVLEFTNITPDFTLAGLRTIYPARFGGTSADYTFYSLSASEIFSIMDGCDYTPLWTSAGISGIDFSSETTKPWVKLSATTNNIIDDGVDSSVISIQVWQPNLAGIMSGVNKTAFRFPVTTPDGIRYARINITNGVGSVTFKTTLPGQYIIPANNKRYNVFRIFNQLVIDVDDASLLI
jgi:hypothetical protein